MTAQPDMVQALFEQFLDVCNQAMQAHREEFPYAYIWEAAEQAQATKGMHITLYDDEPKGDFRLRVSDKHIDVLNDTENDNNAGWRINTSYMKQVLADPQSFIDDPSKLDWQWLRYSAEKD